MNCIIVDDDEASSKVLLQLVKHVDNLNVTKVCSNSIEALDLLKKGETDLAFLDVEMPEMNGIDMLKVLDKKPQVILTTSHVKYAIDAFELNVIDYLAKPLTLPRFLKAMDKVKENKSANNSFNISDDYFFIKNNSILMKVLIKDVLLIEALGDYVKIHTKDQRYVLHTTLKSLENKLPGNRFVRVHRSYIVQIDYVKQVEDTTIYINDVSIPIGAIYKDDFMKRLNLLH